MRTKLAKRPKNDSSEERGDVGYGNPPRHTRFKPGKSGNPRGRPRRNQDGLLNELIGKELYQPVRIQQDGRTLTLPRIQVAVRRLAMDAMKGHPQAVKGMVQLAQMHDQELAAQKARQPMMTHEERAERISRILAGAKARKDAQEQRTKEKADATVRSKQRSTK